MYDVSYCVAGMFEVTVTMCGVTVYSFASAANPPIRGLEALCVSVVCTYSWCLSILVLSGVIFNETWRKRSSCEWALENFVHDTTSVVHVTNILRINGNC